MAMTLRLDPEDDQLLRQLASQLNTSRQRAVVEAVRAYSASVSHQRTVSALAHEEAEHYRTLLDRLGK